ncbi:hypothetical protein CN204_04385 [Sinorhizobium meliloti]|uniref:hypothetical protein n=1 Tax=Rhizobium meliloti TaxID=382 RepID=UPI000FDC48B2|nr:hypothetical protein [Sinorhizobium meliloti]RVH87773.1 hypothetical protein CN204_04385 [Sinorhizobium meliloti]
MTPLAAPYIESIQIWKRVLARDIERRSAEAWKDTHRRIEGCKQMIEFYRLRDKGNRNEQ